MIKCALVVVVIESTLKPIMSPAATEVVQPVKVVSSDLVAVVTVGGVADVIESAVAWRDGLKYYGKSLSKGTWFGAIKINDARVWEKVVTGKYKAFSVRISGVRKPINQSKENG